MYEFPGEGRKAGVQVPPRNPLEGRPCWFTYFEDGRTFVVQYFEDKRTFVVHVDQVGANYEW